MQYIAFLFIYGILSLISILPFKVLYFISDIFYIIIYKILKYRVKTVRGNIELALPHLTRSERIKIEEKFYSHFCDIFVEMIKTLSITEEEMKKRYIFKNIELLNEYEKKNKSIILMAPHYASWEWIIILGKFMSFKGFGVYKRLQNKYFDQLVRDIRSKFDAGLITTSKTVKTIRENQENNIHGVYLFLSDQSPTLRKGLLWDEFMGVNVPVHTGAEFLAKELDLNILYLKMDKIKRGYYSAEFVEISDNIQNEPEHAVTKRFLRMAEQQITEKPEWYFWTHKRWKHKDNNPID